MSRRCRGAAVRAARRAGTEPGRPHGPGGPARPAPAAKLKGGRSLSLLFPTAPPRAPGGAQAGLTSGPRVTRGGIVRYGTPPASRPVRFSLEVPRLLSNCLHWASRATWALNPRVKRRRYEPRHKALWAGALQPHPGLADLRLPGTPRTCAERKRPRAPAATYSLLPRLPIHGPWGFSVQPAWSEAEFAG